MTISDHAYKYASVHLPLKNVLSSLIVIPITLYDNHMLVLRRVVRATTVIFVSYWYINIYYAYIKGYFFKYLT